MIGKMHFYGTQRVRGGLIFSLISSSSECGIEIFDKAGRELNRRIAFTPEERMGHVYMKRVEGIDPDEISYRFYEEKGPLPDWQARQLLFRPFGEPVKGEDVKALVPEQAFDWQGDTFPKVPAHKCVGYCLHVRGFTRHPSSRVRTGGTFSGLREKLPYLQELGVTTLELEPAYEFLEREAGMEGGAYGEPQDARKEEGEEGTLPVLNYWGYKRGFYYAPKSSYAEGNPVRELKELIRDCHSRGMELVMQFYFPCKEDFWNIQDILCFWRSEYHVDGFRLMGQGLPVGELEQNPFLAECKLWFHEFTLGEEEASRVDRGLYQDGFMYDMKRFLKGDEGSLSPALYRMRTRPEGASLINYITSHNTMTLWDTVTYNRKHNEDNGEDNRDGNDYTCSWNCGFEGETRKKKIMSLRIRQVKNGFCLLLLSQGIPLIFMGDEFGNSQRGNNNPYCQDNELSWLDWGMVKKRENILQFVKGLIALRRSHPILQGAVRLRMMDSRSCGYPDLSYHGELAWRASLEGHDHHVGILYCGRYAEDDFLYIAYNMHWEMHEFAIPRLPGGLEWELVGTTMEEAAPERMNPGQLQQRVPPRTVNIYRSRPEGMQTGKQKQNMKRSKK